MAIFTKILRMLAESHYMPKNNPSKPLGEDAHFISRESQVIGVADGVGGWAKEGIDSGVFSRELMRNAADFVRGRRPGDVDPKKLLEDAFSETESLGSSTACILALAGNLLRAANLGDSGFLVIREGKAVYGSVAQQKRFNHPYQVGWSCGGMDPVDEMAVEVERGDVVVVGTDGLFDNLFLGDIETAVAYCLENKYEPGVTAWLLCNGARLKSMDEEYTSPFDIAAEEAGKKHYGGKKDDITVIVAYIC